MPGSKRTVSASTDDLRSMLMLMHSTLVYGATVVALTLVLGWSYVGIKDDLEVPTMLPILAIAATLFSVVAWTTQEEIQQVGKPYRTSAGEPEQPRSQP